MRKILLFALLLVSLSAGAQSVHRVVTLKSVNAGAVTLQRDGEQYMLKMRRPQFHFFVMLGTKEEAVKTLLFLSELKLKGDDYVVLDNSQQTKVGRGPLGGHALYDTLGVDYCVITRGQAKELAKVIESDEVEPSE